MKIVNAIVKEVTKKGKFHSVVLIHASGEQSFTVTRNELVTLFTKAMLRTKYGLQPVTVTILNGTHVMSVDIVPGFGTT